MNTAHKYRQCAELKKGRYAHAYTSHRYGTARGTTAQRSAADPV